MIKKLLFLSIIFTFFVKAQTGSVGINTATPNLSSVLDVSSDSKGLLIPRLTTSAISTLSSTAAEGLMVFDKEKKIFLGWDGTKWQILGNTVVSTLQSIAAWEVSAYTNYGASPANAATTNTAITTATLERGSGLTAPGGGATATWGGSSWDQTTLASASTNGDFALITLNFVSGKTVSFSKINALNFRRSASGADTVQWQFSIDGTNYTNIGSPITGMSNTTGTGNNIPEQDLTSYYDLQNMNTTSITKVYFKLIGYGSSATGGNFYINNITGNDLEFTGIVQ